MALKFILGRSGSGKSSLALHQISEKQNQGNTGNLILMVPEQFSLQAEKDLIHETCGKGIMQAKILSFHRLAHTVFKETGMPKGTSLTDISHTMALKKIVLDNKEKLIYFKKAANKQGFMDQLTLTVSELFSYSVSPESLERLKLSAPENSILKNKLSDLLVIYTAYKDFLDGGYVAGEEALDILYTRLDQSTVVKNAEIWLDGFYGFTPQELNIIEKLLLNSKNVTITLTMDSYALNKSQLPMTHIFFETKDSYLSLMQLAKGCGVKVEPPIMLTASLRFKASALAALEQEYPLNLIKRQSDYSGISLFAASNNFDEVEYVAEKIISLVRDNGYRYRDIAVLAASLTDYEAVLNAVMTECEIPFFMDSKHEIESHPLVELVKGMPEILIYNFSFDSIFAFLKTGLTPMNREDIEILENYCLAYGIKGYKWQFENWSFGMTDNDDSEKYLKINGLKRTFLEFLQPLLAFDLKKQYFAKDISCAIFNALENLHAAENLTALYSKLMLLGETAKASEAKQCWNIVVDIIDALTEMFGNTKVTLKDYYGLLESGLAAGKLGILPPSIDNITIGTLERTRLPKVKALFLIGVNDGVIPSSGTAEGLLADDERDAMESNGTSLAHNNVRRAFEENYLIYSAITKAENNLFITYSLGDLSGKSLLPSGIISKIRRIFPTMPLDTCQEKNAPFFSPAIAFHHLGEGLKSKDNAQWLDALDFFENHKDWKIRTKLLKEGLNISPPPEFLKPDTAKQVFGKTLYSSVSKLEKFSSCPYSYFLSYTMKARERKIYQLNTPDLGLLFHAVLEDFSSTLKLENLNWRDLRKEDASAIVNKIVDQQAPSLGNEILLSTGAMKYLIERLKRICNRAVWTLCCHLKNGNFTPFAYELGFGIDGSLPPIAIELKDGDKLLLTGKIDRVDILKADGTTFVKIIDYKSGTKDFSLQEVYYGLQLQLLIYIDAIIKSGNELFGSPTLPGGIFYFRIKDPMVSAEQHLTVEDIEELITQKLRMSGLVLDNNRVVTGLDNTSDKKSKIIPVEYTAKGEFSEKSSIVDEKVYEKLQKYAVDTAASIGSRIKQGEISVKPYKLKGKTPCSYCPYKGVCGFEEGDTNFGSRSLKSLNEKEAMQRIDNS